LFLMLGTAHLSAPDIDCDLILQKDDFSNKSPGINL